MFGNDTLHTNPSIEDYNSCCLNSYKEGFVACNNWKNRIKLSTFQKYNSVISNHISNSIGKTTIEQLSSSAISRFTDELVAKGLSYKTINLILIVLNMELEFAKEQSELFLSNIIATPSPSILAFFVQKNTQILFRYCKRQNLLYSYLNNRNYNGSYAKYHCQTYNNQKVFWIFKI